ncbi:hypothetical protein ACFQLX_20375 [Streptomyces polyrhachis]|uniref:LPXTG cell wall anchor domain-containing protein n=1 Tax=Streptomyces polyrhachis TaxID=1282885 RepID=A0ABW2GNK6_9ACTN
MSALHTAHTLAATLASGTEEHGHDTLNPYAIGGGALAALLLLLWITTRFNRDR